ncbi:Uncharacterised protein [Vibrio cholerae]|nr:Uncharacterised protein [Vibrio cholerae]
MSKLCTTLRCTSSLSNSIWSINKVPPALSCTLGSTVLHSVLAEATNSTQGK